MKTSKKGISLIVLVITIIVMIILATVIIITLNNSGIIGRASKAVEDMNEAQMKELVTLAWVDAYMTVTNEEKTDDWYYNYVIEYLKANGISQKELDKYIITADKNGANAILKSKVQSDYGFYYDMIYTGTIDTMGTQLDVGVVFFEDEKALTFMKVNDMAKLMGVETTIIPNEYIVFSEFGEWNLKYSNNTSVAIDPETGEEQNERIEFSNEGKTATVVNSDLFPEGTILTLSEEEGTAHGIYLGEDYEGSMDGVGMYARINQDGSAALTVIANNAVQNMPAGSFALQLRNYAAMSTIEPISVVASLDGNVVYMIDMTGNINIFQRVGADNGNIPTKNQNGFYYNMMYVFEQDGMLEMGLVFYEDNTANIFLRMNNVLEQIADSGSYTPVAKNEFVVMQSTPAQYNYLTASVTRPDTGSPMTVEFINEGTAAILGGVTGNLAISEGIGHGVYYGSKYSATIDGAYASFTFNSDGSAVGNDGANSQTLPAGTLNWVSNGYMVDGEMSGYVFLSFDGKTSYMNIDEKWTVFTCENPEDAEEPEVPNYISHNGTIPTGGTYYRGVTSTTIGTYTGDNVITYTAGQAFPTTINNGDVYVYGDYEYRYNMAWLFSWDSIIESEYFINDGWGVVTLDKTKTSYEEVIYQINGKNVAFATATFAMCNKMVTSPKLPDSITDMRITFTGCSLLRTVTNIPKNVKHMLQAFNNCSALEVSPTIPNSVTEIQGMFYGCTALKTAPTIPSGVTTMYQVFEGCTALVTAPTIPSGVTSMDYTFTGCTALKTAPTIPNNVTSMDYTFKGCTALKTAPTIPNNVTSMSSTFEDCTALTGNITIKATRLDDYDYCFLRTTQSIVLIGTGTNTTVLNNLKSTATNNNVTY